MMFVVRSIRYDRFNDIVVTPFDYIAMDSRSEYLEDETSSSRHTHLVTSARPRGGG